MSVLDKLYNKYYPPTALNRIFSRNRNKNRNFSLICGNCMGGYIYHQLGLPFLSPTVNIMIYNTDLLKFAKNLRHYLSQNFLEAHDPEIPDVPCGKLDDVLVHFTHFNTFEDGCNAWYNRAKRVDYDNIYIISSDIDLTDEQIKEIGEIPSKKTIVLTSRKLPYKHCLFIPEFKGSQHVGELLGKTLSGKWRFEKYFDYVEWLNSDDDCAQNFYIGKFAK